MGPIFKTLIDRLYKRLRLYKPIKTGVKLKGKKSFKKHFIGAERSLVSSTLQLDVIFSQNEILAFQSVLILSRKI